MTDPTLTLGDAAAGTDPFALFSRWLGEAEGTEPNDPNAVCLASVDEGGLPDARMVLLKGFDARGFVIYTNFESAKGRQLLGVPKAALCFHWKSLRRQVRARGRVEVVSEAEADSYYASRPRGSRIGAWASAQSRPLESRAVLEERVADVEALFPGEDVPRPAHWSGFRLVPIRIEFWQDGAFRLHDRIAFARDGEDGDWRAERLYP